MRPHPGQDERPSPLLSLALESLRVLLGALTVDLPGAARPPTAGQTEVELSLPGGGSLSVRFAPSITLTVPLAAKPLLALIERLQNREERVESTRLAALLAVGQVPRKDLDLKRLYEVANHGMTAALGIEACSVLLVDEQSRCLHFQQARGEVSDRLAEVTIPLGEGVAGWVAVHGQPVVVNDCSTDPRFSGLVDRTVGFSTRNLACVPLSFRGQVIGVLEAVNHPAPGGFSQADLHFLEAIAAQAGAIIGEARAFQALYETLETVVRAQELSHGGSGKRSQAVVQLAVTLGERGGLSPQEQEIIRLGCLLKNIGAHLAARGGVEAAWTSGAVLAQLSILSGLSDAVLHVGENFDGSGLPGGLAGERIPICSRVIAIAEEFFRGSQEGKGSFRRGLKAINGLAGTRLDGRLVRLVEGILEDWGYLPGSAEVWEL